MTRSKWMLAGAAAVAILLLLVLLPWQGREEPARAEDGAFAHDCCGTIKLEKGRILVGNNAIRYSIDRDAQGPFILPATYVGPYEDRGFEVDGARPALKLRPDTWPRPNNIEMEGYGKFFRFKREPAQVR